MVRAPLALLVFLSFSLLVTIGCQGENTEPFIPGDSDSESANEDGDEDTAVDGDSEDEFDLDTDDESEAEHEMDGDSDVEMENEAEIPDHLPTTLPFSYTREDVGNALSQAEIEDFTRAMTAYYKKVDYFNWILRISYGVHESTGMRDWSLWWTSNQAVKSDGEITIVHPANAPTDGGHNMMTRSSKVLASNIAGYLLTGDEIMGKIAEQYCKGVTASMLGMVYDENDPIDHLMARNIITFNQTYTTHDGRVKHIDYSGWYQEGESWNTQRFPYPDNPYWGEVYVTNMRSKDDVSRLMRATSTIAYAAERAPDANVRDACAETFEYMQRFAKDIVDSGYFIRTKDKNGDPFKPGGEDDPEADYHGDLASYVMWEDLIPNAECNPKRAAALLGYGSGLDNECGLSSGNSYEEMAISVHYFNIWIIRSYHLSNIAQSLIHYDFDAAKTLLEGLAERYANDRARDPGTVNQPQSKYDRDLASSMMQAAALGYPLTSEEARLVMSYYRQAITETIDWPYWDLWSEDIPDGTYSLRPPDGRTEGEEIFAWVRPEDMGAILDYCWSPFRNPDGVAPVDCDIIADQQQWDAGYLDK